MATPARTGAGPQSVSVAGVRLAVQHSGPADGRPVVLLHGLTMTRNDVLMGSTELEDHGFRVVAYDVRGHGQSQPPASHDDYGYEALLGDLRAVLDAFAIDRAVLVGSSLGSHTALLLALREPERVAGLALVAPAYDPRSSNARGRAQARRLADALRSGGIEAFLQTALRPFSLPDRLGQALVRRRLSGHDDLLAVADALEFNPRFRPYRMVDLVSVRAPTLVVGTRDDLDPFHPYALAHAYADAIPNARFVCEAPGRAPLAWSRRRMGQLARELAMEADW
jgi:pimeloyl-ACP methyl ester carboxylesterase